MDQKNDINKPIHDSILGQPIYVSTKTLGQILDVSEETLRTWIKKKVFPYYKIGNLVRFNLSEIQQLMRRVEYSSKRKEILKEIYHHAKI